MRVLLDTHAFLWFVSGNSKLSRSARLIIENPGNELLLSAASIWELGIKSSLGRITFPCPLDQYVAEKIKAGFVVLPITWKHAATVANLPLEHRDPFDRMLVAQAICEKISIITRDTKIANYGVNTIW